MFTGRFPKLWGANAGGSAVRGGEDHLLATSTWLGSTRLEHATFDYDRLGHATNMTRYLDATAGSSPVTTSWRTNSIGEVVEVDEPSSAPQLRAYDSWGELTDTTRSVTAVCPPGSDRHFGQRGKLVMTRSRRETDEPIWRDFR